MDAVRLGSDKSYWLPPQNEHVLHPYSVLAHAMRAKNVVGVAKATVWSRQWPVCIEVVDGMLALTQLHPLSAIRSGGLQLDHVTGTESKMASAVIDEFTATLEPEDLVSDADDALKSLVTAKLEGKEFSPPELVTPEPTMNILDALKASLESAKGKPPVKKTTRAKVKA
jgi:DNA end-binding protein Ku